MSSTNTLKFNAPLKALAANSGRIPLGDEQARQEGYQEGRGDYDSLRQGIIQEISQSYEKVIQDISHRLPDIVIAAVKKVIGEVQLDAQNIANIIEDVLASAAPEDENLNIKLSPSDYAILVDQQQEFIKQYSKISFSKDESLSSGDCIVSSRFGLVDAKVSTKLQQIKEELA